MSEQKGKKRKMVKTTQTATIRYRKEKLDMIEKKIKRIRRRIRSNEDWTDRQN